MKVLSFEQEFAYGDTHRISVPIRVENLPYLIDAILDTGAGVSCFDRRLLPHLGIADVRTGRPIEMRAADNNLCWGYLHTVRVEFLGRALAIPVAFCPDWPEGTPNLLGMRGFFEQMLVAFDHQNRTVHYTVTPFIASPSAPSLPS